MKLIRNEMEQWLNKKHFQISMVPASLNLSHSLTDTIYAASVSRMMTGHLIEVLPTDDNKVKSLIRFSKEKCISLMDVYKTQNEGVIMSWGKLSFRSQAIKIHLSSQTVTTMLWSFGTKICINTFENWTLLIFHQIVATDSVHVTWTYLINSNRMHCIATDKLI